MNTYNLQPSMNEARASFYGKAKVKVQDGGNEILQSYDTDVAEYRKDTGLVIVKDWYSQTTARHINSFLESHGKSRMTKQEMINTF